MTSPLVLPAMLKQLAPLGIDWASIGATTDPTPQQNLAALMDICFIASDAIDTECEQPLRSTADIEQLQGPDQRLYVENNGVAVAQMQHWPITEALGVRICPTTTFPYQWQAVPQGSARVRQGSAQIGGSSFLGASGSDGMNLIEIQPGYVGWQGVKGVFGRNYWTAELAYINGWPSAGLMPSATAMATQLTDSSPVVTLVAIPAGLVVGTPVAQAYAQDGTTIIQLNTTVIAIDNDANTVTLSQPAENDASGIELEFGYPAGVTSLNVDDVTGMNGSQPTIFEGAVTENVTVIGAVAADPPVIFDSTITVQAGPGVITLRQPTRRAHVGSDPAFALVSAMPSNVRMAGYYYAGAEALQRGSTAYAIQAVPGSLQTSGGTPSIGDFTSEAQNQLKNFHRIF